MSNFLVVKVLDVNYNAHAAARVDVLFAGTGPDTGRRPMNPTNAKGVFEIQIPDSVDDVQIGVDEPGFFPIGQDLRIKRGGPAPVLVISGGGQEVNVRNVDGHARGAGDFNLEVFVVLGQLQDTKDNVEALANANGLGKPGGRVLFMSPVTLPVIDFTGLTVLNTGGGSGWGQLIHSPLPAVVPRGRLFFAERTTTPKLLAIWVPEGVMVTNEKNKVDPRKTPLNFHVFYHPSPGVLRGRYPFDFAFVDLMFRYLLYWKVLHKQMVNQHQASGSKAIMVFPVGDPSQWNGALGNQTSVLRLLQEVAYFVQRRHKIPFPLQPVGKCAVSGFSAGGQYVLQALGGDNPFFHDNVLAEIYAFDIRTNIAAFGSQLKKWWRGGANGRAFRIYTTDPGQFNTLEGTDPGATLFNGAGGAKERQGPQTNVVLMPVSGFWTGLRPESPPDPKLFQTFRANFDDVHQMIPALFLEHALKHAKL
jgi:hypothetical protein